MSRADIEAGVRAALKAAAEQCYSFSNEGARNRILTLDPVAIAATVPEQRLCLVCGRNGPCEDAPDACTFDLTPQEIYEVNMRLRARISELERESGKWMDALNSEVAARMAAPAAPSSEPAAPLPPRPPAG